MLKETGRVIKAEVEKPNKIDKTSYDNYTKMLTRQYILLTNS
jgi:hypothetical protein